MNTITCEIETTWPPTNTQRTNAILVFPHYSAGITGRSAIWRRMINCRAQACPAFVELGQPVINQLINGLWENATQPRQVDHRRATADLMLMQQRRA